LRVKYKSQWLEYERSNDITILKQEEKKLRDIFDNAELSPTWVKIKEKERNLILENSDIENKLQNTNQLRLINQW
jgi:hypothetical protein